MFFEQQISHETISGKNKADKNVSLLSRVILTVEQCSRSYILKTEEHKESCEMKKVM